MFWTGLAIGLFVGIAVGGIVICMCKVSACEYPEVDDEFR